MCVHQQNQVTDKRLERIQHIFLMLTSVGLEPSPVIIGSQPARLLGQYP